MEEILNNFNKIDNQNYYFNYLVAKYSLHSLMLVEDINFMRCLLSFLIFSKREILNTDFIGIRCDYMKALNFYAEISKINLYYSDEYYNNLDPYYINTDKLFVTRKDFIMKNSKNEIIFSENLEKDSHIYLLLDKYLIINDYDDITIYYKKNNKYDTITIPDYINCVYQFSNFGIIITNNCFYILTNNSHFVNKYVLLNLDLITIPNKDIIEYIEKIETIDNK